MKKKCKCGHLIEEHNSLGCMHTEPGRKIKGTETFKYCKCRIKKDTLLVTDDGGKNESKIYSRGEESGGW